MIELNRAALEPNGSSPRGVAAELARAGLDRQRCSRGDRARCSRASGPSRGIRGRRGFPSTGTCWPVALDRVPSTFVDWLEILLPLLAAFAIGAVIDRWWAVLLTLVLGLAAYGYATYATDDAELKTLLPLLLEWALATAAGVVVGRWVRGAVSDRRRERSAG